MKSIFCWDKIFYKYKYSKPGRVLTVEMPDQQPDHKSNNKSKYHHADHGSNFPRSLFLFEFFVVRSWEELDGRLPFFVLEDSCQSKSISEKGKS